VSLVDNIVIFIVIIVNTVRIVTILPGTLTLNRTPTRGRQLACVSRMFLKFECGP
jgi:hypothetical protein